MCNYVNDTSKPAGFPYLMGKLDTVRMPILPKLKRGRDAVPCRWNWGAVSEVRLEGHLGTVPREHFEREGTVSQGTASQIRGVL